MSNVFCVLELIVLTVLLVYIFISKKYISEKLNILYAIPFFLLIAMTLVEGFKLRYLAIFIAGFIPVLLLAIKKLQQFRSVMPMVFQENYRDK